MERFFTYRQLTSKKSSRSCGRNTAKGRNSRPLTVSRKIIVTPIRPRSKSTGKATPSSHDYSRQETVWISEVDISIPGIKNVLSSSNSIFRRILWAVAILACSTACTYQIGDRLWLYFSNPVAIQVHIVRNESIYFPAFTICPYDMDSMPDIIKLQHKYAAQSNNQTLTSVWNLVSYDNITTEQIWALNKIDETNTQVVFRLEKAMPLQRGLPNLTKIINIAFVGTCMTVSVDRPTEFLGPAFVLRMEQTVSDDITFKDQAAFTIFPHEAGAPAKHHAFFKGQIILRGYMTSVALTITTFKAINSSSKLCEGSVVAAKCWTTCLEKYLNTIVNCSLPYMTTSKLRRCETVEEVKDTYDATEWMYMTTREEHCRCLPKCVDTLYNLDKDVRAGNSTKTTVDLYFQDDSFEIISEVYSYSFVSLVCDIGGNLGIYLGFCLLTLIEILEASVTKFRDTFGSSRFQVGG